MDSYMNEINNKPANVFYHFRNINVSKFNGVNGLNNLLYNFVGLQGNQENPLNFNIHSYMNKSQNLNQNYLLQDINIKYLKINEHFFTYFNVNPILRSKYDGVAFKIVSGFFHSVVILEYVPSCLIMERKTSLFDVNEYILTFVGFVYIGLFAFCLCICFCFRFSYNFIRIDIIFSNDFNKLFIGVSKNNDLSNYTAKYEFFLNTLDRFLLQKNQSLENNFFLEAINKQSNLNATICTILDNQIELEGLLYLLNERLNIYYELLIKIQN